MSRAKKAEPKKIELTNQFLANLEMEDPLHNDHGFAIIGRRDLKPQIPDEEEIKKKK